MNLTESQEMYLLTIYRLQKKLPIVRETNIADELKYTRPSAHKALKVLAEMQLINFVPGDITLSQMGKNIALKLEDKHNLIFEALVILGLDKKIAAENACKIEHVLSNEVYDVLKKHMLIGQQKLMSKMMVEHN